MMRQSLGYARFWRLLQAHKVAHGCSVLQVVEGSGFMSRRMGMNVEVRQGLSSYSRRDVGNPPTEEGHPGDVKTEQGEKQPPSRRPEKVTPTTLEKEYSVHDLFHDKAKETEERLFQKGKVPEVQHTKK